jgi:4-hydroxy-3-methylbut-2-enyl diphosphate reductase
MEKASMACPAAPPSEAAPDGPTPEVRPPLRVLLAAPRGFCAGVRRAIDAVTDAIDRFGAPVYVRRAIVHNHAVVRELEALGAVFVQEVDEVPSGAVLVLSAHGVARSVADRAHDRRLRVVDAMCPLVAKVHREVRRHHREGRYVILLGHRDHPEVVGTVGQLPAGAITVAATAAEIDALPIPPGAEVAFAVQTTFSVDDARVLTDRLAARFDNLHGPSGSDICYATTNRQAAVRALAPAVDAVIVVGEDFSSNARRLAEVAEAQGCRVVQLAPDPAAIDWRALDGCRTLAVTAAASTPESSVAALLEALDLRFSVSRETFGNGEERAAFRPVRIA